MSPGDERGRRAAWVEVDLDAIIANVAVIRHALRPGAGIAAVVKAEAYGHGATAVATALAGHVDAFAVATLDEGLALRAAGLEGRVIVLYPVPPDGLGDALAARIEPSVMSSADVEALERTARRPERDALDLGIHVTVETGFHRGGIPPAEVGPILDRIDVLPGIRSSSCWSHLAAPFDRAATAAALDRLDRVRRAIGPGRPGLAWHIASSSAIALGLAPELDLVRPGLALYGEVDPALGETASARSFVEALTPAMAVKARAIATSEVPVGGAVGYGGRWTAARPSRVATLPLGYADGLARASQPGGEVLVRGRRVPLVGVVSMDSVGADVTDVPDLAPDDVFVVLGRQGEERISATELARRRTTIAWEVLAGMAARLGRVYHRRADAGPARRGP